MQSADGSIFLFATCVVRIHAYQSGVYKVEAPLHFASRKQIVCTQAPELERSEADPRVLCGIRKYPSGIRPLGRESARQGGSRRRRDPISISISISIGHRRIRF
jgi:hypothetical protein